MIATWGVNSNRGGQFFIAIFPIVLRAFWDVARRKPIKFVVTSKTAKEGNCLSMVRIQMGLIGLYIVAILYATTMHLIGERIFLTGYSVNLMWSFFNMVSLWAIVQASLYRFDG